jgi:hypothetical protein
MAALVQRNRVSLKDFMYDYDRLRRGYCSRGKFKTAINAAFGPGATSPEELACLGRRYKHFDPALGEMVDYAEWCADVAAIIERGDYVDVAQTGGGGQAAKEAIEAVARICSQKRMAPKSFFTARDRNRQGMVPERIFVAVCDDLDLTRAIGGNMQWLVEEFRSVKDPSCVNYVRFCATVDPPRRK